MTVQAKRERARQDVDGDATAAKRQRVPSAEPAQQLPPPVQPLPQPLPVPPQYEVHILPKCSAQVLLNAYCTLNLCSQCYVSFKYFIMLLCTHITCNYTVYFVLTTHAIVLWAFAASKVCTVCWPFARCLDLTSLSSAFGCRLLC